MELRSGKIRLVGELFTPPSLAGIHPALIICHGVPLAPPDPADRGYPLMAERFAGEGFVTLLFNFRGTGESQGNFHLLGWAEDLRAALDYLCSLAEVDPNRVSTLGFSGGAAVSIYVAAQDERIRSLVACASPANFDTLFRPESAQSFVEQARRLGIIREASFPQDLDGWLEEFRVVSPLRWVDRISTRPILLIHGLSDETIPVDHAYQLYDRAGEPKDLSLLEGATHRLRQDPRTIPKAIEWLKEVNRRQQNQ